MGGWGRMMQIQSQPALHNLSQKANQTKQKQKTPPKNKQQQQQTQTHITVTATETTEVWRICWANKCWLPCSDLKAQLWVFLDIRGLEEVLRRATEDGQTENALMWPCVYVCVSMGGRWAPGGEALFVSFPSSGVASDVGSQSRRTGDCCG